jgi:hypothetical protein
MPGDEVVRTLGVDPSQLTTQMDVFQRLLGTTELAMKQFAWAPGAGDRPADPVGGRESPGQATVTSSRRSPGQG